MILFIVLIFILLYLVICMIETPIRVQIIQRTEKYLLPDKRYPNVKALGVVRDLYERSPRWTHVFSSIETYSPEDILTQKEEGIRKYALGNLSDMSGTYDEKIEQCRAYDAVECTSDLFVIPLLAGATPVCAGAKVELSLKVCKEAMPWFYGSRQNPYYDPYVPIYQWNSFGADYIVINLDKHTDRLNKIKEQFERSACTFQRFAAIDGHIIKHRNRVRTYMKFTGGQLGIHLSAMEIYNSLIDEPPEVDFYAILEDDITFKSAIPAPADIVRGAPRDWDMIFLGTNKHWCLKDNRGGYSRLGSECMAGAFGYIIRKRFARYLINFCNPIEEPIDRVFQRNCIMFNMYALSIDVLSADYTVISSTAI